MVNGAAANGWVSPHQDHQTPNSSEKSSNGFLLLLPSVVFEMETLPQTVHASWTTEAG